jgi:hypothetical protein
MPTTEPQQRFLVALKQALNKGNTINRLTIVIEQQQLQIQRMQTAIATLTQTVGDLAARMKNASTAADLLLPQLEPFPLHNKKQQQKNQNQQQQKRKQVKPPRQQQSKIQKKQCERPQKRGNTNPKGVANSTHQENVNRRRSDGDHLRNQAFQPLLDASDQMEVDQSSDGHDLDQDDPKVDDVQIPDDDAYTNPYASAVQN